MAIAAVVLFSGYLRMSRSREVMADGASNVLQAWDMLHGNILLRGWTVSDVSFYTTELPQYALIVLFTGLRTEVVHIAAAMTYTLLVLLAAAVAKGRATGWEAVARIAVAVAIMLVPSPGDGYTALLLSPDHTGTGVPLLVTWLVLGWAFDRAAGPPRWLPYLITVLLTWAQLGDPLALFVGVFPLVVVSGYRLAREGRWRPTRWRGPDAQLALAALASVFVTQATQLLIWWSGGFLVHAPVAEFAEPSKLGEHLRITVQALALNYGAYLPALHGPLPMAAGVVNLLGLVAVLIVTAVVAVRFVRRPGAGERVVDVLAVAIVTNLVAFVVSTQPHDLLSARQIVTVLPFGAALCGRVLGPRLMLTGSRQVPRRVLHGACAAAVLVLGATFVAHAASARPAAPEAHEAADWLAARGATYGIGSYWAANTTTVRTGGRVSVAPTSSVGDTIYAFRWESRADWYDPALHEARFLILDLEFPQYGRPETALKQFGHPVDQRNFGRFVVYVYDRDLLDGLPAFCVDDTAPSMAKCPTLRPRPPASSLLFD